VLWDVLEDYSAIIAIDCRDVYELDTYFIKWKPMEWGIKLLRN